MKTNPDALQAALYVCIDDHVAPRRRIGRPPKPTDAELLCLAVAQVLLGFPSARHWIRFAHARLGHLFRHLPRQSAYNKRLNAAGPLISQWSDDIAISDQAPAQYWPAQLAAKGLPADVMARQLYLHALPDDWPSMDYDTFLTARRPLMAQVVRDAFWQLESDSYRPVYSAPSVVPEQRTASMLPSRRIKLSELLDAGLISAGTVLTPAWEEYGQVAVVDDEGRIRLDGQIHDTPSGAANAAGAGTNGWTFWLADTPEGQVTLADLRAALSEED